MTLNVIQGDDFFYYFTFEEDDIKSADFCIVSGNPCTIPLTKTDKPNIWELKIAKDTTKDMYIGDCRCYTKVEYNNTIVKIFTEVNKLRVNYKYNKESEN